jgi:anthranilate phosphoribosyltransferase
MDEITLSGPTQLSSFNAEEVETRDVTPEEFGLARTPLEQLRGGDAETNARLTLSVLRGESGPQRDVVLANAAAAFVVGGKAAGFIEGVALASGVIDRGRALETLQRLVDFTQRNKSH